MDKIKAFFVNAGKSVRDNAQHVLFGYPYTSATICLVGVLVGVLVGAWVFG